MDLIQTHHRPLKSFSLCSPCTSFATEAIWEHRKLWNVTLQLPFSSMIFRKAFLSYCSILSCLEGEPHFGWSWVTPHCHWFNTSTFHSRAINLTVWLDSNKPSFLTASSKCHIFLSLLAHPELQHFDSYLLPPTTQNSCSFPWCYSIAD